MKFSKNDLAIIKNLKKGIKDAKAIEKGKIKTRSAKYLLKELQ